MKTPTTLFLALTLSIALALAAVPAYAVVAVTLGASSYSGGQTISLTGTGAQSGQAVGLQLLKPDGSIFGVDQAVADTSGAFSATPFGPLPSTPLGTWTVKASQGGSTGQATFTLTSADTTAPTVSTVTLDKTTVKGGASITVTVESSDNIGVTSVTANSVALTLSAGKWTGTITASSTEGSQTISVVAKDAAGNQATSTTSYTVDNTAPAITVSSPADGAKVYKADLTITGTVTDNVAVASLTVGGSSATVASTGAFSATVTLALGSNTITIIATDTAGNSKSTTLGITYSITPTYATTLEAKAPAIAYVGQTVEIWVLATVNGTYAPTVNFGSAAAPLSLGGPGFVHVHQPDKTAAPVTLSKVHNGLWQGTYTVPDKEGNYVVVVPASFNGTTMLTTASFAVNKKLPDQAALTTQINAIGTKVDDARTAIINEVGTRISNSQTAITTAVTNARSDITALSTAISGISTKIDGISTGNTAQTNEIKTAITAAQTALSGSITSVGTDVKNTVNTMKSNLDSVNSAVAQTSTYVIVAAVLALLTLVVELAVLIRKR
ncbi:MAG: hypothetical protein HYU39_07840 [Thaumarchaeota archaeon]|nr:hypothetical protein [Nitrososphaerota archaeon]